MHSIFDEYIGYGYVIAKVFKPAKSHAGEVELLCTYAPDTEYGEEGEYWTKAGLCLVYEKAYVGTESEKKMMNILDEAARSFKKMRRGL